MSNPIQAIVHVFGLDEHTVANWHDRAEGHCEAVHQAIVEQGSLDLMHVQADEIRVKGCKMIECQGLAMMVSTQMTAGWSGPVFAYARRFYAQPPFSGVLPQYTNMYFYIRNTF